MHKQCLLTVLVLSLLSSAFAQSTGTSLEESKTEVKIEDIKKEAGAVKSKEQLKSETGKVEKIRVTGSHIKRIDVEGPSPITVLEREDLDRTGYNSVADVLRDMAENSFGSAREASGSNAAGVASVNLRGMGSSRTLVLLNGRRLPTDAVTGSVDLNTVPMAAVERIEVLKDGASATYGSDALGGVVNIITKKDFSGNEITLKESSPQLEGGKKMEVSLTNGIDSGNLQMTNVAYYRKNEAIFSRNRDHTNKGVSTLGSPGSYRDSAGQWQVDPNCPTDRRSQTSPQGQFCTYKYSDHSTSLPELEQVSLLSDTSVEVSESLTLNFRAGGTQKNSAWQYAPAPGIFTIPSATADGLGLPGVTPGSDVDARYRLQELGNRVSEIKSTSYNVLAGATVAFGDTWEFEGDISHNAIEKMDKGVSGYALTANLLGAMADGSFNPFLPEGQRGDISGLKYVPTEETKSELTAINLLASGELVEMASGPIGMAVGTTYTHEEFSDKVDARSAAGEVFGSAGSNGGGKRDVESLFAEVSLPITQSLEMQVAGRHDSYSDFGSTTNPKVGMRLQVSNTLMVRSSWGTGFKAPRMQDLYASSSIGYPTGIDYASCAREKANNVPGTPACSPQQYEMTSGGNTGLKQEESENINLGFVLQPSKGFSFSVDGWKTKMTNVVGMSFDDMLRADAKGVDVSKYGVTISRDANGYIESIDAPTQNLSSRDVSGLDVAMEAREGKVRMKMAHSVMLQFRQEGFPEAGLRDNLGENGLPRWRNNVTLGVSPTDSQEGSVTMRTIGRHEQFVKGSGNLGQYTEFDFQYNLSFRRIGTLTAGVKNLFGTKPPLDSSDLNNQLDGTLYDEIGRQYYMGMKATF